MKKRVIHTSENLITRIKFLNLKIMILRRGFKEGRIIFRILLIIFVTHQRVVMKNENY